jgi:hypothetical protein
MSPKTSAHPVVVPRDRLLIAPESRKEWRLALSLTLIQKQESELKPKSSFKNMRKINQHITSLASLAHAKSARWTR